MIRHLGQIQLFRDRYNLLCERVELTHSCYWEILLCHLCVGYFFLARKGVYKYNLSQKWCLPMSSQLSRVSTNIALYQECSQTSQLARVSTNIACYQECSQTSQLARVSTNIAFYQECSQTSQLAGVTTNTAWVSNCSQTPSYLASMSTNTSFYQECSQTSQLARVSTNIISANCSQTPS